MRAFRRLIAGAAAVGMGVAAAVGLTPSPAGAAAVACGAVVTDDVVLHADLTCSTGHGLVVGADEITISLNGHTIRIDDQVSAGILISGFDGVTIRDGAIELADAAIRFDTHASGVRIENMRFDSWYGVLFTQGGSGAHIVGNAFTFTMYPLVMQDTSDGNTVRNNDWLGGDLGFQVHGNGNRIVGNDLRNSNTTNLSVVGDDNAILRNTSETGMSGFEVRGDRNIVRGNDVGPTTGTGLRVAGGGNAVLRNDVSGGDQNLVVVGTGNRIRGNTSFDSLSDGIIVDDPTATVAANVARDNAALGIRSEYPVAGGGNRASGNGDVRQCVNVACIIPR